jgi:hypothetical protein
MTVRSGGEQHDLNIFARMQHLPAELLSPVILDECGRCSLDTETARS